MLTDNQAEEDNQNIAPIFGKENLIDSYLESVALQNNNLALLPSHKTLLRQDHETMVDSVKLLSGGAATADPLYSGSIGSGMLTGAVFGEFKKSPPSLTILEVLKIMSRKNDQGILVIVSNNLANRLNFGSACQNAAREGIKTLLVSVGEDVSGVSVSKTIGRKGLCGIKFLFKIAGAMSEEKKTLHEIYNVIEQLKGNSLGTINIQIRPDMMVIGPGCKGESEKLCFLWNTFDDIGENARLTYIVRQALSHLFHPSSYFSLHVVKGDQIVIMVNNLGNLSDFYLSIIIKEILDQIKTLGFLVMRIYAGRFLNSNLAGFSISVLKVKDNILELLDSPVNVTSWTEKSFLVDAKPNIIMDLPTTPTTYISNLADKSSTGPKFTKQEATYLLDVLPNVIETIKNMEEYLNKLDSDHDFGTAMSKFANAIQSEIQNRSLKISTPYEFLDQMAYLAGFAMGGVAGGIFSILFSSAAQVFLAAPPLSSVDMGMWVEAARSARDGLKRFTRVQPGDRTILDALDPFVESPTENSVKGLSKRVSAAVRGAEGTTRTSRASIRSSIIPILKEGAKEGEAAEVSARAPDPGALCLASVIRTIFTSLQIELAEAEAKAQAEMEVVRKKETKVLSKLKEEEPRHGTKLKEEGSKRVTSIKEGEQRKASKLNGKEPRHDTTVKEEETMRVTTLGEEESRHATTLTGDEPKRGTTMKEEVSRHGTTLEGGEQNRVTTLKGEESKSGTTLKKEEQLSVKTLNEEESKRVTTLKEGEPKKATTLKEEGPKEATTLKEEEQKRATTLKEEEQKRATTLKEEEQKRATTSKEEEQKRATTLKEEEQKSATTLKEEEQKRATTLKEEEQKRATTLKEDEQKRATTLKEEEQKRATTLKEEETKSATTLKEEEPKRATTLKEEEKKRATTLKKEEQKKSTTLKEEEPIHVTKLKENEMREDELKLRSIKEKGTKLETHIEDQGLNLKEILSPHHSQSIKDEHSEQIQQLKEVFDDIATEIENEVPDENN